MIAIGKLRFLNLLNSAQNWHKACKMSQKCLRLRENRDHGGFCDSPATEFWYLETSSNHMCCSHGKNDTPWPGAGLRCCISLEPHR